MKIICIGNNYKEHVEELNLEIPQKPLFFLKPESAVLRNDVFFLPDFSNDVHYEVELVIRICRLGRHIQAKFADRYFDSIGLGLDLTARDIQLDCMKKGLPWEEAKSFDGSAVMSSFTKLSEFNDVNDLSFSLTKNDQIVQKSNSSDMIFNFCKIIEYVSSFMTLKIGDVIFTGTPSGVGSMMSGDSYVGYLENKEMLRVKIK